MAGNDFRKLDSRKKNIYKNFIWVKDRLCYTKTYTLSGEARPPEGICMYADGDNGDMEKCYVWICYDM